MNSTEISQEIAQRWGGGQAGRQVEGVELVEFPLPAPLPDLNAGIRLSGGEMLVFSLKAPWTGVFFGKPAQWRPARQLWAAAFGGARNWSEALTGQTLESIEAVPGDRIVQLAFSGGARLEVRLFPARPDWILTTGEGVSRWRKATPLTSGGPRGQEPAKGYEGDAYSHYLSLRLRALLETTLAAGLTKIKSRHSRLERLMDELEASRREAGKSGAVRAFGEALKAVLYRYPKGYYAPSINELPGVRLDESLDLGENAALFFSRYKKLQRTAREVDGRIQVTKAELDTLSSAEEALRAFRRGDDESLEASVRRLRQLLVDHGLEEPAEVARPPKALSKRLKRFESAEGMAIWVGRDHAENEELVIRLARGNDLWLHLKGRPGSHAIVQLPRGKTASLETLLDAAALVAHYSGVGASEKVEVDYTHRKNVKRVPGGKGKFLVTYSGNKTLIVTASSERLRRLNPASVGIKRVK